MSIMFIDRPTASPHYIFLLSNFVEEVICSRTWPNLTRTLLTYTLGSWQLSMDAIYCFLCHNRKYWVVIGWK